jgi:hypothetical protein
MVRFKVATVAPKNNDDYPNRTVDDGVIFVRL